MTTTAEPLSNAAQLLQAENLSVTYGDTSVVNGLDMRVGRGEFVALTGPPGCGKSTAALALLGLTRSPGRISSGRVLLGNRDLLAMDHQEASGLRGSDIALVSQGPRGALHPLLRIGDQLTRVLRAGGDLDARAARAEALSWLDRVGIQDPAARIDAYAHELSTGMAQRVVFAMALCRKPSLLVADEPTSGLDVTIQAQVLDDLAATVRSLGTSVLFITQDLSLVARYCQRVLLMDTGRIVDEQTAQAFLSAPRHPYSRSVVALARATPATEAAAPEPDVLLDIHAARKIFPGSRGGASVVAVDDVDLSLRRGETLGLVGESGSGKTTLARCLLQLETLDGGRVELQGTALGEAGAESRAQRAAIQGVFQDPLDSMNPRWSAARIVAEPLARLTSLDRRARRARALEMLQRVGLDETAARALPAALSAGEQQRVAVARAMATDPALIVLDEPTSVLDPQARAELLQLLQQLQEQFRVSYLFISHDLASIRHSCHRVAVLYQGQIVELGSAGQIFETPAHPYTRALIDAETGSVDASQVRLSGDISGTAREGCRLSPRCPFATQPCRESVQALSRLRDGRHLRCSRAVQGELPARSTAAGQRPGG